MKQPDGYERVPEDYLTALGEISVNVSDLEGAISVCISGLIFEGGDITYNHKLATCLIGSEQLDILIKKLDKLFRHMVSDAKMLEQFDVVRKRIEVIKDDRNRYIHSSWHRGPYWLNKENEVHRSKTRRQIAADGLLFDREQVQLEKLNDLVKRSKSALKELYDFILPNIKAIQEQSRVKNG
jgi:hypothetical protein